MADYPDNKHLVALAAAMSQKPGDFNTIFQSLSKEDREQPMVFYGRARWAVIQNDPDYALEMLDRAIELDVRFGTLHQVKAKVLLSMNRLDEAIDEADKAIRLESFNPDNFVTRGRAWAAQDDRHGAELDFERAIELDPEHARAKAEMAKLKGEDPAKPGE